ncbi:uncharacterized protein LOC106177126 [Lingula anatina]|uniref:Uncharacterized protein LOC106177126 n=1 Tax=Lingula anatina TaxID=7574 RepID=A0A1S3JY81_LINAN|nr:uncharacterized protein LOC106177126 [Lingula anatina]|eukprot:XP_013415267.1 uncharacterized protein LOC106177126 [Lingula anatina]
MFQVPVQAAEMFQSGRDVPGVTPGSSPVAQAVQLALKYGKPLSPRFGGRRSGAAIPNIPSRRKLLQIPEETALQEQPTVVEEQSGRDVPGVTSSRDVPHVSSQPRDVPGVTSSRDVPHVSSQPRDVPGVTSSRDVPHVSSQPRDVPGVSSGRDVPHVSSQPRDVPGVSSGVSRVAQDLSREIPPSAEPPLRPTIELERAQTTSKEHFLPKYWKNVMAARDMGWISDRLYTSTGVIRIDQLDCWQHPPQPPLLSPRNYGAPNPDSYFFAKDVCLVTGANVPDPT